MKRDIFSFPKISFLPVPSLTIRPEISSTMLKKTHPTRHLTARALRAGELGEGVGEGDGAGVPGGEEADEEGGVAAARERLL